MLYLVGLGLGDQDDITVKGLKVVKACSQVYLEAYTSILGVDRTILVPINHVESYDLTVCVGGGLWTGNCCCRP